MERIVEISKYTIKLFFQFLPDTEKVFFFRGFTIYCDGEFTKVIIALFQSIYCIMKDLITLIYHRYHTPVYEVVDRLVRWKDRSKFFFFWRKRRCVFEYFTVVVFIRLREIEDSDDHKGGVFKASNKPSHIVDEDKCRNQKRDTL